MQTLTLLYTFQPAFKTDIVVAYFCADSWLTKHPQEAVKFGLSWVSTFAIQFVEKDFDSIEFFFI